MAIVTKSSIFISSLLFLLLLGIPNPIHAFEFKEATIDSIQNAFKAGNLTSLQLVQHYISEINRRNSTLASVIELNPEAENLARQADQNRTAGQEGRTKLAGIPILVKDNIGTSSSDKMNTTAGSYALLGSVLAEDSFVVKQLKDAGAIILGKASLSQWSYFRSINISMGWSSRSGQAINPYGRGTFVCGSSSGSAISTAANMVTVALGTETDRSIICPCAFSSVVGIKPSVGLTSRSGVIPISLRQDTVGPIARTVTDAVRVLDVVVGRDNNDSATIDAATNIPTNGYAQYLNSTGLNGKRLGILRDPDGFDLDSSSIYNITYQAAFQNLSRRGAILVENLVINITSFDDLQKTALTAEFKQDLNSYLTKLTSSPVRTLEAIITFNRNDSRENMYPQELFEASQSTNGINTTVQAAITQMQTLARDRFEKLMTDNNLDALVFTIAAPVPFLAVGGYPAITVPAGYAENGTEPIDLTFAGLKFQEPKLIQIAYDYEQSSQKRVPPPDNLTLRLESEEKELIAQS